MTNEKEWWKDDKYFVVTDMNEHGETTGERPNIEAIILEAERRGYEKAMKEVSEGVQFNRIGDLYASCPTCHEKHTIAGVKEEQFIIHVPKSFFDGQLTPCETYETNHFPITA